MIKKKILNEKCINCGQFHTYLYVIKLTIDVYGYTVNYRFCDKCIVRTLNLQLNPYHSSTVIKCRFCGDENLTSYPVLNRWWGCEKCTISLTENITSYLEETQ